MNNKENGLSEETEGKKGAKKSVTKGAPRKAAALKSPPAEAAASPSGKFHAPELGSIFEEPVLLNPPKQRAAYSDRTAWLMSALSELAYFHFEQGEDHLEAVLTDIVRFSGQKGSIRKRLTEFLAHQHNSKDQGTEKLAGALKVAGFTLDGTYNLAGTQGFMAHRAASPDSTGMRVLVFRGTEPTKFRDIWTDLDAKLVPATGSKGSEKIHRGFQRAFEAVRSEIEEDMSAVHSDLPLYITGHSLGGALAVVATWFIAHNSLGACYTFGGPRVGNMALGKRFKTPIYRVVNSADIVPRVPPSILIFLSKLLKILPVHFDIVIRFIDNFAGYVHFGDMRYLRHKAPEPDGSYKDIEVLPNPSQMLRVAWFIGRILTGGLGVSVSDHDISKYRRKLCAYALQRNG